MTATRHRAATDFSFVTPSRWEVRKRRRVLAAAAGPVVALLVGAFFWQASFAERSVELTSPGNGWQGGTVALSDDRAGTALFTATSAAPGTTQERCIAVRYDGDVSAVVRMAVTDVAGDLPPHLQWAVDEGTGGGVGGSCTGYTSTAPTYTGTLETFAAGYTDFDSGFGNFTPTAANETKTYRVAWTIADTDAAQDASASFTLRWEARAA